MAANGLKTGFRSLFSRPCSLLGVDVKVPMCGAEGKGNLEGRGRKVGLPGLEKALVFPASAVCVYVG